MTAHLIITVDTEEEGLWGGRFRPTGNTVENVQSASRFQALCDRFGVRPTYLVDAPVVEDPRAVALLRSFQDEGRAEIGGHLHPWCNPPLAGASAYPRDSYLCNLPASRQRDKLRWLTDAIEDRFGRRPTSFRAGRYGLDSVGARLLADAGYLVDSSVIPFTNYSPQGGSDFRKAPCEPYYPAADDLCAPADAGVLVEVPVSVGYSRRNFRRADALRNRAMHPLLRRLRAVGVLDRLGIARRIKFSPEQSNVRRLRQLVDASLARGTGALVMMFHSSSLLPGHSPYVRNAQELEIFYHRLEQTLVHCLSVRNMLSSTLSEFAREFLAARASRPASGSASETAARLPLTSTG